MTEQAAAIQLSFPDFAGTAGILLLEVEGGKRPAVGVPVAEVSSQFLKWMLQSRDFDLVAAGELLRTGAKLAALKSSLLLAQDKEVAEVEPELESTPWLDVEPVRAAVRWMDARQARESFPLEVPPGLMTPCIEPRSPRILGAAFGELLKRERRRATRVTGPAFVRLETAVSSLIRHLRSGVPISLRHLLGGGSRQDAVVHFLAILELIRRREASAEQPGPFGDITVTWTQDADGSETESRAG